MKLDLWVNNNLINGAVAGVLLGSGLGLLFLVDVLMFVRLFVGIILLVTGAFMFVDFNYHLWVWYKKGVEEIKKKYG